MLIVTGTVEVSTDGVDKAIAAAQRMVAETVKEPGCLIYEFSQILGQANRFRVYEEWQDQAALEAHFWRDRAEDEKNKARKHLWNKKMPLFARGLLVSGDHLFVAGPEDIVDEEKFARQWNTPEAVERMQRQSRLFAGKEGGMLWVVNKKTGEKTAELKLDTIPVFDGLAAARGRLYISGVDGRVVCFK